MSGQPANLRPAAGIPYHHRHELTPDVQLTIQDAWVCASAGRYGEPYETGWAEDPQVYREHDGTAEPTGATGTCPEPAPLVGLPGIALIVTAVFAERAGIGISAAITRELVVISSRGWREDRDE
jgi:hypothetical protein